MQFDSDSMPGFPEPRSTKFVIFGGKSINFGRLGFAKPSSVQTEKMTLKFSQKHVQTKTGHIIHCPMHRTAVWDCTGQAHSRCHSPFLHDHLQPHASPLFSFVTFVVRFYPNTIHQPSMTLMCLIGPKSLRGPLDSQLLDERVGSSPLSKARWGGAVEVG